MNNTKRSIFRSDAVRRYIQGKEKSVLPRFISPRTFICLWFLLGLLMFSGFFAWFVKIPVYASGSAVVVDWSNNSQYFQDDVAVVAFVPAENLSHLNVGQTMFLNTTRERLRSSIIVIEPKIINPATAQNRFALTSGAAAVITQPVAVSIGRFKPMSPDFSTSTYIGSIYNVDIEIGSRRVISLLPLIGHLFEG